MVPKIYRDLSALDQCSKARIDPDMLAALLGCY